MSTVWFSKKTEEQRHVWQEQNAVFERYKAVLKLESNLIRKTVFDYSFWDELVDFVETVNEAWSKENLESIITTFDVDYIYVFDKQKKLIYAYHPHHDTPLLPDIKTLSTSTPQFKEFFQESKGHFSQFFVAPIHYSADIERKGEPLGFFLIGREWDASFLNAMEEISLGKATLSKEKEHFRFLLPLKNLNDSEIGYLRFNFTPSVLLFMTSLQNSILISGLIVMVTVIFMFYLLTKDTFLTPIQRISNALKTHKPFYLLSLAQQKNELGEIATLILEYEKQKQLLEHYKEAIDENTIVSKTDAKGIITYINDQFIAISGYEREELIGKPHNIVRHPDNSPEFFHEMWKELKSGKTWKGIVKNRRKDGSAYY
ncbi:MAG: PAS domain S-box protein, partial [Sulfurospirillum sp.]|nr:PAS domain S-box protein [Sulfurospirillum sp.]